jgi:hypothetical protein
VDPELLTLWNYSLPYVVHGLAPGLASVCVKAHFSDGTDRQACQPVTVAAIAHVATSLGCENSVDGVPPGPLVPPGATLYFGVELLAAGGGPLEGYFLHPIDDGAFVAVSPMGYGWDSPAPGTALAIGSPLDPTFAETFATYDPAQVTGVAAGAIGVPPLILTPGEQQSIQVAVDVGSTRACKGPPVTAKTESPGVCLGPNGELAWSALGSITSFTAVTEGTCQLSVGVVGGSGYPATVAVPFYLLNPRDKGRDASVGDACMMVGVQTCDATRDAILVCTPKHKWALASSCNGTLCDYTEPAVGCGAAHGCVACR